MSDPAPSDPLATRLEDRYDDPAVSITTDEEAIHLSFPDRTVVVERRPGPDGDQRWTLALRADGATVSKFGPFETREAVLEEIASLIETEIRYTVCCDG